MTIIKNKTLKITSDLMKVVISSYYRYKRRYKYICTEYNSDGLKKIIMDVCASNGQFMTEVETKISYSDLVLDKSKKIYTNRKKGIYQYKHKIYSGEQKNKKIHIPNYFYFAITYDMYKDKKSVKWIKDNFPDYGIMYVVNEVEPRIIKRPTMLHKNKVGQKELSAMIARITSENICLRKKIYELKNK